VHKESISIAVLNFAGKVVMECVIGTKASTILQFIHGLRGDLRVTFEEGTWAGWLYDLLKPHVTELVVCNPRKIALLKDGSKSDRIDAHKLADLLYMNKIKPVYHGEHGLRMLKELSRSYLTISKDLGRVMKSAQGLVSELGNSLCRDASLRTALPFGMVEQDHRSWRAPAGGTLLPTTRRCAAGAPTSPKRAVGRG
jgi:Transposase